MQDVQKYKPIDGVNVDTDDKYLKNTESRYLLNVDVQGMNTNDGVETPYNSNNVIPFAAQPAGVNTPVGKHYSKKTKELYVMVHNSNADHHIYRINPNRTAELVLQDANLGFVLGKRHQMTYRAHLFYNDNNLRNRGNKQEYKFFAWTNGSSWQGFLDVETSIATNGFRVSYFNTPDRKVYWELATRPSLKCCDLSFVTQDVDDANKNNNLLYTTWQFRIKFIYTDGRETTWGPISDSIFHQKSLCESEESYERCIKLIIDAGTPCVEKIVLAYRNCAGNFTDTQNPDWFICDYIEKYDKCLDSNTPFYERSLRGDLVYDAVNNTFEYVYCGDKLCIPVDRQETDRNYNDIPITSFGLFPLDERLGLANNTYRYDPIDCEEVNKITFTPQTDLTQLCKLETVTVKVAIIIHNIWKNKNQFTYIFEDDSSPLALENHRVYWGGLGNSGTAGATWCHPAAFKQYFEEKGGGFITYVETGGAKFYGKTKQYFVPYSGGGTFMYPLNVVNYDDPIHRNRMVLMREQIGYFLQVAEIKVPKGTKGFVRVASHLSTIGEDYGATSTNVMGVFNDRLAYANNTPSHDPLKREIYFEACAGDVDLTGTPFWVADLYSPDRYDGDNRVGPAMSGYLRAEEIVGSAVVSSMPVERAEVLPNYAANSKRGYITDHNGYYFGAYEFWTLGMFDFDYGLDFKVESACAKVTGGSAKFHHSSGTFYPLEEQNVVVSNPANYITTNYTQVKVLIQDVNGTPLSGVWVAAEGAKAKITGSDGYANFILRNRMVAYGLPMPLRFIPMQSGLCPLSTDLCDFCVPVATILMPACFDTATIDYTSFPQFNSVTVGIGLQPSGTYPLAVKFIDDAGRESDAQGDWKVDMPGIVQLGVFALSTIAYSIPVLNLPSWIAKMAILIGKNRNQEDAISWVIDEIKYVDGAGNAATNAAADKIKISIRSLYETQRSLNNINVKYQFKRGDRIRFLVNGDGNIFTKNVDLYIESDDNNRNLWENQTSANPLDLFNYLIVSFTSDLSDLKVGAQIQIYTPRVCENQDYYYETCQLISIRGQAATINGTVNAYDTYLMRRQISYDKRTNFFAYPFLHHSPSDFWGDHCLSRGRVSVKNPYEKQVKLGRNIAMSLPLFTNGNYNGLSTYLKENQKNFTGEQRGDVIAVISIEQFLMFLLEHDNFISSVGDDFVKVDSQNRLRANSGDLSVSDANSKIVGNYGIRYEDVSTIVVSDGWVFWLDVLNKAPVVHDFQVARNIAKDKMETYFNNKLKTSIFNAVAGLDPARNKVHLTIIRDSDKAYVHSRHAISYPHTETVTIDIARGTFSFSSFTPELYGHHLQLNGEQLLISFRAGLAYDHSRFSGSNIYNTFFGTSVDQVLDFILNQNPDKVKFPLAMEIQSDVPYWAELITTSLGQQSIIVPARSRKKTEGKHNMEFVCDTLSPGGLYNGNTLRGYTIRIRLVRDNTQGDLLNTIDVTKQRAYNELDSILVKYSASEQSGHSK